MQAVIPLVYSMSVAQVTLSQLLHSQHSESAADPQQLLQLAVEQKTVSNSQLAAQLVPLLTRLSLMRDLASQSVAAESTISPIAASGASEDVAHQLDVLLCHLNLPTPSVVLQGLLVHPQLHTILSRFVQG